MKTIREVELEEKNKKLQDRIDFLIDKNDEKQERIDKAIEYIEIGLANEEEAEELLNILKGDNK